MNKRHVRLFLLLALVGASLCLLWQVPSGRETAIEDAQPAGRPPRIRPDYANTVIPPNIGPLNFCVEEHGAAYSVKIRSPGGQSLRVFSKTRRIRIPRRRWQALLKESRGREIHFDVYVKAADGQWQQFDTITNTVAAEEIDGYLVYRQINVLYHLYAKMRLCQRNLENYDRSVILDNRSFGYGCMNCHTFFDHATDKFVIHMRSAEKDYGAGMLLSLDNAIKKVDTRTQSVPLLAAFSSWHPGGRVLAFSIDKVRQFFHSGRTDVREGIDLDSDLAFYVLDTNAVLSVPSASRPDRLETWPAWSPDGRYLYYCSAPKLWDDREKSPPEHYDEVRYDLMRISYDVGAGAWGEPETVLESSKAGFSISLPRVSPDGRFMVFCATRYGGFPALQPDSDLYLMDLSTERYSRMTCNTERSESWHSWSSNSRWLAFSSKRDDGLFMRVYFSYIAESGTVGKPFVLPQKDPTFYDSFTKVYQMPELIREPVPLQGEEIARVIRTGPWIRCGLPVTAATP